MKLFSRDVELPVRVTGFLPVMPVALRCTAPVKLFLSPQRRVLPAPAECLMSFKTHLLEKSVKMIRTASFVSD